MPHATFFNLPDEKRQQIIQIALEEFAENDYDSVSVSRIVARAGIAKGSFYQYFADKEDLHAHLLGMLVEAKTAFLSLDHPDPSHIGIFAYLRWTIERGVAFELRYPLLTQVGLRALKSAAMPKRFTDQVRDATLAFYQQLVALGKAQGDIRPEIDDALAATMFDAIMDRTGRHILDRAEVAGAQGVGDGANILNHPQVRRLFEETIQILERGLGPRGARPADGGE